MPYVPEPCIHLEHPISNQKTLGITNQHPKKSTITHLQPHINATTTLQQQGKWAQDIRQMQILYLSWAECLSHLLIFSSLQTVPFDHHSRSCVSSHTCVYICSHSNWYSLCLVAWLQPSISPARHQERQRLGYALLATAFIVFYCCLKGSSKG